MKKVNFREIKFNGYVVNKLHKTVFKIKRLIFKHKRYMKKCFNHKVRH